MNTNEHQSVESAKSAIELHQQVLMLWGRYTDLVRDLMLLQGQLADLQRDAQAAGKAIYGLYGRTDERLDQEPSDAVDRS